METSNNKTITKSGERERPSPPREVINAQERSLQGVGKKKVVETKPKECVGKQEAQLASTTQTAGDTSGPSSVDMEMDLTSNLGKPTEDGGATEPHQMKMKAMAEHSR